jgi:hypothetical protein
MEGCKYLYAAKYKVGFLARLLCNRQHDQNCCLSQGLSNVCVVQNSCMVCVEHCSNLFYKSGQP